MEAWRKLEPEVTEEMVEVAVAALYRKADLGEGFDSASIREAIPLMYRAMEKAREESLSVNHKPSEASYFKQAATDRAEWGVTDETPHVCDEAVVEIQRLRLLLSNITGHLKLKQINDMNWRRRLKPR